MNVGRVKQPVDASVSVSSVITEKETESIFIQPVCYTHFASPFFFFVRYKHMFRAKIT